VVLVGLVALEGRLVEVVDPEEVVPFHLALAQMALEPFSTLQSLSLTFHFEL
jgi:hypothetical protein